MLQVSFSWSIFYSIVWIDHDHASSAVIITQPEATTLTTGNKYSVNATATVLRITGDYFNDENCINLNLHICTQDLRGDAPIEPADVGRMPNPGVNATGDQTMPVLAPVANVVIEVC